MLAGINQFNSLNKYNSNILKIYIEKLFNIKIKIKNLSNINLVLRTNNFNIIRFQNSSISKINSYRFYSSSSSSNIDLTNSSKLTIKDVKDGDFDTYYY
jgi:hypothetical protein